MAATSFDVGDVVRLAGNFQNQSGTDVDPGVVTVKVKNPIGAVTAYVYGTDAEVIRDSAGNYHADIAADKEGVWFYRWEGSGVNKGAGEDSFTVADSQFY